MKVSWCLVARSWSLSKIPSSAVFIWDTDTVDYMRWTLNLLQATGVCFSFFFRCIYLWLVTRVLSWSHWAFHTLGVSYPAFVLYRWMWRLTERGVTGRRTAAESQWSWEASRQTSETPAGSVEVCPDCTMSTHARVSKSWLVGSIPCRKIAEPMLVFWGAQGSHAWLCRQAGPASDRVSIRASNSWPAVGQLDHRRDDR